MKAKFKFGVYAFSAVLILAITCFAFHYYLLGKAFDARLAAFRQEHKQRVDKLIGQTTSPEFNADIHAFVSSKALNGVLEVLVGRKYPISKTSSLSFSGIKIDSEKGTPLIKLDGEIFFGGNETKNSIVVRGIATISPPTSRDGVLYTRLQLIALEPIFKASGFKLAINGHFGDLLKSIGQDYLDRLPEFSIPVRQKFDIPVSGSKTAIQFPTRPPHRDTLKGILTVEGFVLSSSLEVRQAHFLPDGLHLFLGIEGRESANASNDDRWTRLTHNERLIALSDSNVDYFIRVNHDAINYMVIKLSSLPKTLRTVSFVSTGLKGNIYYWDKEHRGPFNTLLYREVKKVYLEHPDAAKASVELISLKLANKPGALVGLKLEAALEGHVQLHWHYDPGPTGGVGGNVGVRIPRRLFQIEGQVRFSSGSIPMIEALVDGPESIKIDASVGLGRLGNMQFSQKVSLPKTVLFSAPIPSGIQEQIEFDIGGSKISRKLAMTNFSASPSVYGLNVSGSLKIE